MRSTISDDDDDEEAMGRPRVVVIGVIGGCGEECEAVCLAPTFISSGRFDCLVSLT
jgi:hypothetical protein